MTGPMARRARAAAGIAPPPGPAALMTSSGPRLVRAEKEVVTR